MALLMRNAEQPTSVDQRNRLLSSDVVAIGRKARLRCAQHTDLMCSEVELVGSQGLEWSKLLGQYSSREGYFSPAATVPRDRKEYS